MRILNLTQHAATPSQIAEGVIEYHNKKAVQELLTFVGIPTRAEIEDRASTLAMMAGMVMPPVNAVMIGGAPWFMSALEAALKLEDIPAWYSFNERKSVETTDPVTGVTTKVAEFVHSGWIVAE